MYIDANQWGRQAMVAPNKKNRHEHEQGRPKNQLDVGWNNSTHRGFNANYPFKRPFIRLQLHV